ncbi:MAG: WhiB family transcriptional regulator [Acidimicrobiales bacterium]
MSETERSISTWRDESACRGMDANIFFPDSDEDAGPARAVCATCPVRTECLDFALATRQDDGIWGGLTENERRRVRRRRQEDTRIARRQGGEAA